MTTSNRAAALLVFGLLSALVANAVRSQPLPWVLDATKDIRRPEVAKSFNISMAELREHVNNYTATVIDARNAALYEKGHLRGAILLPSDAIEANMGWLYQNLAPSQLIIIYCDGGNCEASHRVFDFLRSSNFTNLKIFEEGWAAIEPSDLPKETGPWTPPGPPDPSMDATVAPQEPQP